jgi:hypothetical protein
MKKRKKLSDDPFVKAVKLHGLPTVVRALGYAACWAVVTESIGHAPTREEYREWWNASQRTAYRDWEAFKQVTGMEDPGPIVELARQSGLEFDKSARSGGGLALVPFMHWNLS